MEIGVLMVPEPGRTAPTARMVEELGLDRVVFADSQNLAPEVWGQLMLAAAATARVRLGPGVTNSITRDPAVTASAALALQAESQGRAVLGIGRGDSSVQRIGKREDSVAGFERYLVSVQAYLRGETVDREGFASRLEWLDRVKVPKVPVEVAATGRKVIEVAARHADAICFAVGADPEHLAGVLAHAKAAALAAGRARGSLRYGAFVNCVVHDDAQVARDAVRGSILRPLFLVQGESHRRPAGTAAGRGAVPARALRHAAAYAHRRAARPGPERRVRGLVRHRRPRGDGCGTLSDSSKRSAWTSALSFRDRPACRARLPRRR